MTERSDSKMSENNNIPKHWQIKELREVCEKVQSVKRKEKDPEEELLYLDIGGIDNSINKILSYKKYKWKDAPSRAQQIVYTEDVLFSTVRTYMKNIALIENKNYEGQIASSGFCVIRPNKKILSPKFVFHYSLTNQFLQPLNKLQTGSSYPAVRDKDVFSQSIPLPPLPEQLTIVSKIEELFSELENGKQQLQTALQQLKVYRQSLLKAAFEGKLTGTKNWISSTIGEICDMKAGFFVKASEIQDEYKKGLFPCYGGNGLRGYTKSHTHEGKFSLVGRQGALCGNVHLVSGKFHATEHAVVTTAKSNIDIVWLFYKLTSMRLNQYSQGAAQPGLSVNKLLPIKVEVPPIKDQQKIVSELESKLTVCDKIEETITQSLQQAETLRQSILKKAFEGKLVPSVNFVNEIQPA